MTEPAPHGILFVTGTGTGVGKTIVTAAIAAAGGGGRPPVAVVKLAQTGVHDGPGSDAPDLETVTRLSGVTDTHELARFPDPLSPEAAARVSGLPPVSFTRASAVIDHLATTGDLVLVEGPAACSSATTPTAPLFPTWPPPSTRRRWSLPPRASAR